MKSLFSISLGLMIFGVVATSGRADLFVLHEADFAASSVVTVGSLGVGTPIDGKTIGGLSFGYVDHGKHSNAAVVSNVIGSTKHLTGASILGGVNQNLPDDILLTVDFAQPTTGFGFGWAISGKGIFFNVVGITLFDGSTRLGSFGYDGIRDPDYTGGFAGIGSTVAFTTAKIDFHTGLSFAGSFLANNFVTRTRAVPEPSGLVLAFLGVPCVVIGARLRRSSVNP